MNSFVAQAPVIMVIVREKPNMSSKVGATIKNKDYSLIDIGIATENICLQAKAEGIGSCIIGWFDERMLRKILLVPGSKRVELIITLGYSLSEQREKRRKPAAETVSYLSLIHISEPTRLLSISYAVFCLKKKNNHK